MEAYHESLEAEIKYDGGDTPTEKCHHVYHKERFHNSQLRLDIRLIYLCYRYEQR